MQLDAGNHEYAPHNQGGDDAPEEDFVLMNGWHLEVGEDEQEDEEVVEAERPFHQVACRKFDGLLLAHPEVDEQVEGNATASQMPLQVRASLILTS